MDPRRHPDFAYAWLTRLCVALGQNMALALLFYFLHDVVRHEEHHPGRPGHRDSRLRAHRGDGRRPGRTALGPAGPAEDLRHSGHRRPGTRLAGALIAAHFVAYTLVFLVITVSVDWPNRLLRLPQWLMLLPVAILTWLGSQ
ncbi:hypothetical protein [Thermoactinospora rubra]|uniref:hypothetical protein n=1 Tax=Thermoactinospora rubra TaxID=1088767 RepID=UPI000A0F985F|nr:hypothetical protein [Thermoactinospora rubra]